MYTEFHWESAFVREIPNPTLINTLYYILVESLLSRSNEHCHCRPSSVWYRGPAGALTNGFWGVCYQSSVYCGLIVAAHPWQTWLSKANWFSSNFKMLDESSAWQLQKGTGGTCPPHTEPYHAAHLLAGCSQPDEQRHHIECVKAVQTCESARKTGRDTVELIACATSAPCINICIQKKERARERERGEREIERQKRSESERTSARACPIPRDTKWQRLTKTQRETVTTEEKRDRTGEREKAREKERRVREK